MMHRLRLCLLVSTALLTFFGTASHSSQKPTHLRLSALLFDGQAQGDLVTLWVRIENLSKEPLILCRPYWSYSFKSADPNGPVTGEADASIHGCGDRDHDPFWLVLPGQSRFDSFEVKGLSEPNALLQVDVELDRTATEAWQRTDDATDLMERPCR